MNRINATKTVAALLSALTLLTTVPVTQAAVYDNRFRDVSEKDWFYDSVAEAYTMGIVNGVSPTEYAPDKPLDLASCIKLACCVHQLKQVGTVTLGNGSVNWYDTYVAYALENGIISEAYGDYTIPASRAQIAVIFSRVISEDETQINAEATYEKPFADVTDRSLWYYNSVYRMYAYGIMTGDDTGNFKPESKIKRSEIAAVAVRMLNEDRRVTVSLSAADTPKPPVQSGEPILLHKGGTDAVPFTGLTGFSVVWQNGTVSGYSTDCINDVTLAADRLTFRFKKDVGLTAMGIVRGWLNNAALTVDGVSSNQTAESAKEALDSRFALYVNGRKAALTSLAITTEGGDLQYTFTLTNPCLTDKVTDAVLVCGELPDTTTAEAKAAITAAKATAEDPFETVVDTTGPVDSVDYTKALEQIENEGSQVLFRHETNRLTVLYTVYNTAYRLRFVYRDGTVQEIVSAALTDIHVNENGTVLYYSLPTPDGSPMEYSTTIGTSTVGGAVMDPSVGDGESDKGNDSTDLEGTLSGLNITLSAKDKSLIALMEGEGDILFRGVYSDYATAFSVVTIPPKGYFSTYTAYFDEADTPNRIFALKDGIYYAVVYPDTATDRVKEAAERVISSVVTKNPFDIVYSPADASPAGGTYLYLQETNSTTIVGDPFLWFHDDTADNGYRIENTEETKETYQISPDCEVYVLAMDYAPCLKTTYSQFYKIWPLGSKWNVWRAVMDPKTNTVIRLIQQYVP